MNPETLAALFDKCGETLARSILMDHGTRSSRKAFEHLAAVRHARQLMDKRKTRAAAGYELHVRYGISLRTADTRTSEALNLRPGATAQKQGPELRNPSLSLDP
ncbi:MAG: hypothetical protein JWP65_655 [Ramlibacter sp.]|uniref:hypothetical protein n=1 Tax=Ramlibacter sp. TaxID=1917967 RepID=UPI00260B0C9D|nr:hypothetical protein [Ramlibacter sp.]MDB5750234.1 hypothetical protein [Ramlibacter sp.]